MPTPVILKNQRKTATPGALPQELANSFPVWRRAAAPFALLKKPRKTAAASDASRQEQLAPLPVWGRAWATLGLLKNPRKTAAASGASRQEQLVPLPVLRRASATFALSSITIAIASACLLAGAEKQFHPGAAASYAHQTSDNVVVGAQVYNKPELVEEAFGKKVDFHRYGLVPVLVVIENNRKQPVDLRSIEVNLVGADGRHAAAVKPQDIGLMASNGQRPPQVPMTVHLPKRKAAITSPEITNRAFAADMLAPGDSASGFFYFNADIESGDEIYINGLQEATSGREITYFEFPFER